MTGWSTKQCPDSACRKKFCDIEEAVDPRTGSLEGMFQFVNRSGRGRITKEELVDWYTTNFEISRVDATKLIDDNWHAWDVPKARRWLGFFRSHDQGDLDKEEFQRVQEFMKETFEISQAASSRNPITTTAALATNPDGVEPPHSRKRCSTETAELLNGIERNVQQRKQTRSEDLQRKLRDNSGRSWFDEFDRNSNGELEREELVTAMLQTVMGSHTITRAVISEIVETIWEAIDTDGSGSVGFDEFQLLREALVVQLDRDKVSNAVGRISSADTSSA